MKAKQMLVLSVLAFGVHGVAQASPYPSDAEASFDLPALETHAEQQAARDAGNATWAVTSRQVQPHDAFPFGGGHTDD